MKRFDTETERRAYAKGRADTVRNVSVSVTEAIREAQEAAWDEGYGVGVLDGERGHRSDNPYSIQEHS